MSDPAETPAGGDPGVFVEARAGRTLTARIRLWTDKIATGGEGHVVPGHAWYQGTVSFIPNDPHGISSSDDPIMFNSPAELGEALIKAAQQQGVTLLEPGTGRRLT